MIVRNNKDLEYVRHYFIPIQNKLLNKHSEAESHFERLLVDSGIYFRREKGNYRMGTRWSYYDFYLPLYSLYIEIDGKEHETDAQKEIDREKERLVRNNYKFIIRFTNDEVMAMKAIDFNFLLDELCKQESSRRCMISKRHKRRFRNQPEGVRKEYFDTMEHRRSQALKDMQRDSNFEIDDTQQIWLYDNSIGNYFCFKNIMETKFAVEMSINTIHELCETQEYKKSHNRRFVFAYTLKDCELRVIQVY